MSDKKGPKLRTISFEITGRAIPWKSPNVVSRRGMGYPVAIKPQATRDWQAYVRLAAAMAAEEAGGPLVGAILANIVVTMAQPASWPAWKRRAAERGDVRPTKRPDSTNVLKAIEDAMSGPCFADDCQIVSTHISRWYAPHGEAERVTVTLREIGLGHACKRDHVGAWRDDGGRDG